MRKSFITLLLFCFYVNQAWGAMIIQQFTAAAGGNCMEGTYILAWDGDHSSGTDYACHTSGAGTISGANNGPVPISSSYGEGGSNGALCENTDSYYVDWTQTAGQYMDSASAQTLWIRMKITATPAAQMEFFRGQGGSNDYLSYTTNAASVGLVATYRGTTNSIDTAYAADLTADTWTDVAYSWDEANGDHTVQTTSGWQDDDDELTDPLDTEIGNIVMCKGYSLSGSTDTNADIYITQWALVSGYKASKPSGW